MLLKSHISISIILLQMHFFSLSLSLSGALSPSHGLDFSLPSEHSLNQSSNVWCAETVSGAEREIIAVMLVLANCSFFQKKQKTLTAGDSLWFRGSEREMGQQWF